jgi:hypothetical protein
VGIEKGAPVAPVIVLFAQDDAPHTELPRLGRLAESASRFDESQAHGGIGEDREVLTLPAIALEGLGERAASAEAEALAKEGVATGSTVEVPRPAHRERLASRASIGLAADTIGGFLCGVTA